MGARKLTVFVTLCWLAQVRSQLCGGLSENVLYYITNAQFNCVMDVASKSTSPGTMIDMYSQYATVTGHENQVFYIWTIPSRPGSFMIFSALDSMALDIASGQLTTETPTCADSQIFTMTSGPNSMCNIVPTSCNASVLGSPDSDATCWGAGVVPASMNGSLGQLWYFQTTTIPNFSVSPPSCISGVSATTPPCPSSSTLGICNGTNTNWVCAKNYPQAALVTTAIDADSCFCLAQQQMTQQQASTYCASVGGFLTDVQTPLENMMLTIFLNVVSNVLPPVANPCAPNGVLYDDGRCYAYHTKKKMAWDEADEYCGKTYGSNLVSIHDKSLQTWLYQNLTKKCDKCDIYGYWSGGHNHGHITIWNWTDGTQLDLNNLTLTKYSHWPPQPDHPDVQHGMIFVKPDGGWGDWHTKHKAPFVCAYDNPLIYPTWISLQRTSAGGHSWYLGPNGKCQVNPASYLNVNSDSESNKNTGYLFQKSGIWKAVPSTFKAGTAICRYDRNFCGRNPCPSSTPTCTNSPSPNNCFTCA